MSDVNIDSLQLEIMSDASQADKSLDRLTSSLMGLNTSLKKIGNNAGGIRKLASSLSALNNFRIPDFSKTISQLETLSKINLKNLRDEQIKLDIKVSGLSETERMKVAVQRTAADIRKITDQIAKDLANAYNIKGQDRRKLESFFADFGKSFAKNGSSSESSMYVADIFDLIGREGKIATSDFNAGISSMETEYKSFLEYLKNNKIKLTSEVDKSKFIQNTSFPERANYFNQRSGTKVDSIWSEMLDMFPSVMSGMRDIINEEDQVYAILEKIREAKDAISVKPISALPNDAQEIAWSDIANNVSESLQNAQNEIQRTIADNVEKSGNQIPINLSIDEKRFEDQIGAAIERARNKDYGTIDVKIGVDTSTLTNQITTALGGANIQQMQGVTGQLKDMVVSMKEMAGINVKETGISTFVNGLARLSKESGNFIPGIFPEISSGIDELSTSAESAQSVVTFLQKLNSFVGSSKKMEATANIFPTLAIEIQEFIDVLANAGSVDSTLRMAEAITQIAKSSGRASSALRNVGNSASNVGSSSKTADVRIRALKDGFTGLYNAIKKVVSGLGKFAQKIGSGIINGVRNLTSQLRGAASSKSGIDGLHLSVKTLLGTLIGFRGITGIFNWVKDAITAGGDITEIDHIVDSVYGNMSDTVKAWANTMIDGYGIASGAAKQYAGTLTAMATASGVATDKAAVIGMKLTEAAGDLSAFFNIGTEEAYQKIQSAMAGQVRPLRSLGIDISATTLKEYALEQGITKSYTAMTQAEKVMLRYDYIMNVLSADTERGIGVTGDYQRTQDSYANSLRKLQAYLSAIKTQMGVGFAATLRPAIVAINKLMSSLLKAAASFATFMKTLFPFTNGASGLALGDSADYADDLADGVSDAAEGLGDADDNAKKLKKDLSVLPFDELNQLNKDKESTTSGSSGGTGGGVNDIGDSGLFDWDSMFGGLKDSKLPDEINKWAEKIRKSFENHDWKGLGKDIAGLLNSGIDKIYNVLDPNKAKKKINPFIDAFTTTFNSLVKHIHWNTLGRDVGRGINIVVDAANRLVDPATGIDWQQIGSKFADGANGLVDEIDFVKIGNLIGNKFMSTWDILYGFATDFNWERIGEQLGSGINGLNDKLDWRRVSDALTTSLNGAFKVLASFANKVDWKNLAHNISGGINRAIRNFDWKGNARSLNSFISNMTGTIAEITRTTDWKQLGESIGVALGELDWKKWLSDVAGAFIKALGGLIEGLLKTPDGTFAVALAAGFAAVKVATGLDSLTANIATYLTGTESVGVIQGAFQSLFSSGLSGLAPALGGVALAVSTIAGGIFVAKTYIEDDMPKISNDVANLRDDCEKAIEKVGTLQSDTESALKAAERNANETKEKAQPLITTLESLAKKTGELTEAEKTQKEDAIDQLIEYYPGLNSLISEHDSNLSETVSTIKDYVAQTAEMAKADVYYQKIKEAAEELVEIEEKQSEVQGKVNEISGKLEQRYKEAEPIVKALSEQYGIEADSLQEVQEALIGDGANQGLSDAWLTVNGVTKHAGEYAEDIAKLLDLEGKSAEDLQLEMDVLNGELGDLNNAHDTLSGNIEDWTGKLSGMTKSANETAESVENLDKAAEKIPTSITTGVTRSQGMPSAIIEKMSDDMIAKLSAKEGGSKSKYEVTAEEIPEQAKTGVENKAQTAVNAVGDMAEDMHDKFDTASGTNAFSGVYVVSSEKIPEDIASGIKTNQHKAVEAITKLCSAMRTKFDTALSSSNGGLGELLNRKGGTLTEKLADGIGNNASLVSSQTSMILGFLTTLAKDIEELNTTFWNAGHNIAQNFANGLKSVNIEVPHIQWDGSFTEVWTGPDTMVSVPNYTVKWWAKGGLFTKATMLAGVGEAGDEGVIPLSDKRAMARIANAIVDNSEGFGMSKQDMVDAYVYAMAMNSQNQPPVNVYATLYTEDNEVLARSVERGQRSRDARFNPTTAYGY